MEKVRIIKREHPDGNTTYTIQQNHFLFRWMWVDAWVNSSAGANCNDTFPTLEEAKDNTWQFDGSKSKEKIVYEN